MAKASGCGAIGCLHRHGSRREALLARLCGFEVLDIYRGYAGDREDLRDISTAARYRSNLIWILRRKEEPGG